MGRRRSYSRSSSSSSDRDRRRHRDRKRREKSRDRRSRKKLSSSRKHKSSSKSSKTASRRKSYSSTSRSSSDHDRRRRSKDRRSKSKKNKKSVSRSPSPKLSASEKLKQNVLSIMDQNKTPLEEEPVVVPSAEVLSMINADSFKSKAFSSSTSSKPKSKGNASSESALNPTLAAMNSRHYKGTEVLPELSIFNEKCFEDESIKMARWLEKLAEMRKAFMSLRQSADDSDD